MIEWPSAEEIASWPAPNYVNPETRRPLVLATAIPLLCLVAIAISVRFYSRIFIVRALGADDWVMLFAAIASMSTSAMMCVATEEPFLTGYHLWDLTPAFASNPMPTGLMGIASQLLFVVITMLLKISILLTYLRVFPSATNKWFCYGMLAYTVALSITTFCLALFQCMPIQAYWQPFMYPDAKCLSPKIIAWATGIPNIFSDFMIFLWPAKDLMNLKVSLRQRVTLVTMFCFGAIICVAGVCRLWYTSVYVDSFDVLYNGANLYAIVTIETSMGIICGCIPACKPLLSRLFPRIFSAPTRSSPSTPKRSKKGGGIPDGPALPLTSITGSIIKSQSYSIEYGRRKTSEFPVPGLPDAWVYLGGKTVSPRTTDIGLVDGDGDGDESVLLKGKKGESRPNV
ncbi:unnamed protein product [Periconia digitata]|uniref:Rhodopsin domain-containing protein n=1 Tax=Periconia digitata TaxID=1303443 RepID=A0A9W4XCX3_9PLEO|nr:unnamed protein product [Periconia digitata]